MGNKKRPRAQHDVNVDLVEIYEDLANENETIRLKAATRLMQTKLEQEALSKVLKRLYRGLCSSRKAARLGFSIALTEFLRQNASPPKEGQITPNFTLDLVLKEYKENTEIPQGTSGQVCKKLCSEILSYSFRSKRITILVSYSVLRPSSSQVSSITG
jgi:DNA polymerase phi